LLVILSFCKVAKKALKFIDEETLLIQKLSQNWFERKVCIFSSNFSHKVANIFPTENRSHSLDEDAFPPSINVMRSCHNLKKFLNAYWKRLVKMLLVVQ